MSREPEGPDQQQKEETSDEDYISEEDLTSEEDMSLVEEESWRLVTTSREGRVFMAGGARLWPAGKDEVFQQPKMDKDDRSKQVKCGKVLHFPSLDELAVREPFFIKYACYWVWVVTGEWEP